MTAPGPILAADGLVKVFNAGRTEVRAVDGVSVECGAGEVVLIMGPSGSGKTTLLSILGGLLRPTSGRVVIDGVDLWSLRPRDLLDARRGRVGFVFQAFNLLETLTALENVEVALNVAGVRGPPAHERARALLAQADLMDRADFRTGDLSGGERQRVAIARALANRPRLLLADEPTGSLDSRQGGEVMRLLRALATGEGSGVVIVSHDQRLLAVADRVLWMEDGKLAPAPAPADTGLALR